MRTPFSRLIDLPLLGILALATGCQPGAPATDTHADQPTSAAPMTSMGVKKELGTLDQDAQRTAVTIEQDVKQAMPPDSPQPPAALPAAGAVKSDLNQAATDIDQGAQQAAARVESRVTQGVSQFDQQIRDRAHQVTDTVIEKGENQVRQNVQRAEDELKRQFGNPR